MWQRVAEDLIVFANVVVRRARRRAKGRGIRNPGRGCRLNANAVADIRQNRRNVEGIMQAESKHPRRQPLRVVIAYIQVEMASGRKVGWSARELTH